MIEKIKSAINTRLEALEKVTKCECISMEVFTLGFCYIDMMGGFYGGKSTPNEKGDRDRFTAFVRDFLQPLNAGYSPDYMYKHLRCGLVHSAAPHGGYVFTHKEKDIPHLAHVNKTGKSHQIHFQLPSFINDLRKATEGYFKRLDQEAGLKDKAIKRQKGLGLLIGGQPIVGSN